MNHTLLILPRAGADIDYIFDWIRQRSPRGGKVWYEALFSAVSRIAENPQACPIVSELLPRWQREIRESLFKTPRGKQYRIVFELTNADLFTE
jgi:plasmid stabilization system protein ParE